MLAGAVRERLGLEKFRALATTGARARCSRTASARRSRSPRRRRSTRRSGDATFEELRKHFSEREIAELVVENAKSNFYNLLNVPLEIEDDGLLAIAEQRAARRS